MILSWDPARLFNHLIDQLSYFKTFPSRFNSQAMKLLREFAFVLNEEDSAFTEQDYLKALVSPKTLDLKPHSGGEAKLDFYSTNGQRIKDIRAALMQNISIKLRGASVSDFGSLTNFGVSLKHVMSNPGGLTGNLLRHDLLATNGYVSDSIGVRHPLLTVRNEKVAFLYYLQNFRKSLEDSKDLLTNVNILLTTLHFLNFTSYWGFFSLYKIYKGDPSIALRRSDGIMGTKIYRRDAIDVLSTFPVDDIIENFDRIDDNIFGVWISKGVVDASKKTGYKSRLKKMLGRAL